MATANLHEMTAHKVSLRDCLSRLGCDTATAAAQAAFGEGPVCYDINPDGRLAVSYDQCIAIAAISTHLGAPGAPSAAKLVNCKGFENDEYITSFGWLPFAAAARNQGTSCLLVGTSTGYLQVHSDSGTLLYRHRLHTHAVQKIRLRTAGRGLQPEDTTDDITIVFDDALVRVNAGDVLPLITRVTGGGGAAQSHGATPGGVVLAPTMHKWAVPSNVGPRSDGVILGTRPATLKYVLNNRQWSTPKKLLLLTSGPQGIPVATLKAHEQYSEAPRMSQLAASFITGMVTAARSAVYGNKPSAEGDGTGVVGGGMPSSHSSSLQSCWREGQRQVRHMEVAHSGVFAAMSDSVGRVSVVDVNSCVVVRMWKGCRDAQICWLGRKPGALQGVHLLLIFSPWRSVVEVWQVPHGQRQTVLRVPKGGPYRLMSSTWVCGRGGMKGGHSAPPCWLLDESTDRCWCLNDILDTL